MLIGNRKAIALSMLCFYNTGGRRRDAPLGSFFPREESAIVEYGTAKERMHTPVKIVPGNDTAF